MRVVVTGATGNVGTSVVQALAADPSVTSILGLARRRPDWNVAKTEWVEADVAADNLAVLFREADAVVHLAWLFHPVHDPTVTWEANAVGSCRVFRAAAAASVGALVYASSVGAYSPGPKDEPGVDEHWPTHGFPTAAYSREKAYVERSLDAFEARHGGIRVVRMRPGFIFKREAAEEQRRIFAGPLLPNRLVRKVPVFPDLPGLRFQALHTTDAAEAYRLAVVQPGAQGAYNLAASPVVDGERLAAMLGARPVRMPAGPLRAALAAAWRLHLVPASPPLFDLALNVPMMSTARAEQELDWRPRHTSLEAMGEFFDGLEELAGMETPPLAPDAGGRFRIDEFRTGVGQRDH